MSAANAGSRKPTTHHTIGQRQLTLVSYAQNHEDVILFRALKHIKNGFYIDVGAAWPDTDSITQAFYESGWQGINIEPNPIHFSSLTHQRKRDINLRLAIGEHIGEGRIYLAGATGLSTLVETIAHQYMTDGWDLETDSMNIWPLSSICQVHVPRGRDIHFLKIDVEGFEGSVIRSHDWNRYRPWIVLVEATLPMTQKESFAEWEPVLLKANYIFVYADGINRFYLAAEHSYMIDSFRYPPNCFDDFVSARVVQAEAEAKLAQERAIQAEAIAHEHLTRLQAVCQNTSCSVTAPLYRSDNQRHLIRLDNVRRIAKAAAKAAFHKTIACIESSTMVRSAAKRVAYKLTSADALRPFIISILTYYQALKCQDAAQQVATSPPRLSPRARQIYLSLKSAMGKGCKVDA